MPSLKEYRDRISSVKSTRKITSAMKMVAASKLKKAQEQAEASQPYARAMAEMLKRVAAGVCVTPNSSKLLTGTGGDQTHLLLVVTSDRGLCGGFNGNLVRRARQEISRLSGDGKTVRIVTVGRKARDLLKRDHSGKIVKSFIGIGGGKKIRYSEATEISDYILAEFEGGAFDVCTLLYNSFRSVLVQAPGARQLIPFKLSAADDDNGARGKGKSAAREEAGARPGVEDEEKPSGFLSPYRFEPEEEQILKRLLPRNLGVQIFRALLDSAAGEQAARMTAMDNATRNAGDRINALTLQYNRARQAFITKELIEIISGAEAV